LDGTSVDKYYGLQHILNTFTLLLLYNYNLNTINLSIMKALLCMLAALAISAVAPAKGPSLHEVKKAAFAFIENNGQITDQHYAPRQDIQFKLGTNGMTVFVGNGQLHYQFLKSSESAAGTAETDKSGETDINIYRMDVILLGANPAAGVVKEGVGNYKEYYYLPSGTGVTEARGYEKIVYKEIYPHIDWVLYAKDGQLKYEFVVRPGGNQADIRLQYKGATSLNLEANGSVSAHTPMGTITEQAPYCYEQETKRMVASSFSIDKDLLKFNTGAYTGTLVVDPTLLWSTYYGDTQMESFYSVTSDASGNVYAGGYTKSTANIATTGAYQSTIPAPTPGTNDWQGFLVKFDNTGAREWATYYGGNSTNFYTLTQISKLVCDNAGNVYAVGATNSTNNIATSGSYQPTIGTMDNIFMVKFDASGTRIWGTYFEVGTAFFPQLAYDSANDYIYLAGTTINMSGFATPGAFQTVQAGDRDAFLAKFDPSGSRIWTTYYGGTEQDHGTALVCDNTGNIYLAGRTQSGTGFGSPGTQGNTPVGGAITEDLFVSKFDGSGNRVWGRYFGGPDDDYESFGLAADASGNIYLSCNVDAGVATAGTFQPSSAFGGNMVAGFDATSGDYLWGTYFYGAEITQPLIGCYGGSIYLSGGVSASGLATTGAYQTTFGGSDDAFLARISNTGQLDWFTYFGGSGQEVVRGMYCDASGSIYCAGYSTSTSGVATSGAWQTTPGGSLDGLLTVFSDALPPPPASTDSVWAGDANSDLIADVSDPLAVAVAYGISGATRPSATITWQAEYCADWVDTFTNGVNMKHADCNGDGTVDTFDLNAITVNFGLTHLRGGPKEKTTGVPDLYFDVTGIAFTPGTSVSVPIKLGTFASPINDFYGLATTINIGGIALAAPATISYASSWPGNSGNTIRFARNAGNEELAWAYARRDHQEISGEGILAHLNFTVPSLAIAGNTISFSFGNTLIIDKDMNPLSGYNVLDTVGIIPGLSVGGPVSELLSAAVLPNPSLNEATLRLETAKGLMVKISIVDAVGRIVEEREIKAAKGITNILLPVASLSSGIYLIKISDDSACQTLKWIRE
jgi:hypothetical protein